MAKGFHLQPGQKPFPGFVLHLPLGRGACGEVWEARRAGTAPGRTQVPQSARNPTLCRQGSPVVPVARRPVPPEPAAGLRGLPAGRVRRDRDGAGRRQPDGPARRLRPGKRHGRQAGDGVPLPFTGRDRPGLPELLPARPRGPAGRVSSTATSSRATSCCAARRVKSPTSGYLRRCRGHWSRTTGPGRSTSPPPKSTAAGSATGPTNMRWRSATACFAAADCRSTTRSADSRQRMSAGNPDLSMLSPPERPIIAKALSVSPINRWTSCGEMMANLQELFGPDARPAPSSYQGVSSRPSQQGISPRPSYQGVVSRR